MCARTSVCLEVCAINNDFVLTLCNMFYSFALLLAQVSWSWENFPDRPFGWIQFWGLAHGYACVCLNFSRETK